MCFASVPCTKVHVTDRVRSVHGTGQDESRSMDEAILLAIRLSEALRQDSSCHLLAALPNAIKRLFFLELAKIVNAVMV